MKKLTMVVLAGLMALAFVGCDRKDKGSQEQHDASADEPKSIVTPIEATGKKDGEMKNGDMKKDEDKPAPVKDEAAAPVKDDAAAPMKDDAAKDADGKDEANGAEAAAENDKVGSE